MSELARDLVSALSEHEQTVAAAESLTGGLVAASIVDVPGASSVFRGGVVSYATDLKHQLLGVDEDLLSANGPVDPDVAAQMATGVRERLSADWGVATTGVAGPDPQGDVPPGTVFVAVASADGVKVRPLEINGDRIRIRNNAVEQALTLLSEEVFNSFTSSGRPTGEPSGPASEHEGAASR